MREYELYLVIHAEAEEEEVSAIVDRVTELIVSGDGSDKGEVIKTESRGKRRLAYPINKILESQDTILNFKSTPQALPEIERFLKLDEQVIRFLLIRTDE
jgi:small subunit ribosomal protein S6